MDTVNNPVKQENQIKQNQPSALRKWAPLVVLSLALVIIVLDTTILNVALRTIINDLHTTIENIQWVITAYSLMLAAFTITGGRLGDLFGRKKMFVLGAIIFAIGSFMTSISHTVTFMIWGEAIVEGIGAALMFPATAALVVSNYEGRDRQIGFGVWGGLAAASAALGPVFGGWLTTNYSWRWAFRINVFVAAILVLSSVVIKEYEEHRKAASIDFVGVLLSALGMLSLVFGFIKATDYGWWTAKAPFVLFGHTWNLGGISIVPLFILLGLFILGLFALWESYLQQRGKTPLVSLSLFKNRQFTVATLIISLISLGLAGISFALPVFFQAVKNLDAVHTGFAMLPMSLTLLVVSPFSAYLSKYISPKRLVQFGLFVTAIGFWVLHLSFKVDGSQWQLAPGLIIFGIGMGFIFSQTNNIALSAVKVQDSGEASGVSNTFRQAGMTLGSAILGAILLSSLATGVTNGINSSLFIPHNAKPEVLAAVSKQASNIEFGGTVALPSNLRQTVATEVVSISRNAAVAANRTTMAYAIIFIIMALAISIALPAKSGVLAPSAAAEENAGLVQAESGAGREENDHDDDHQSELPVAIKPASSQNSRTEKFSGHPQPERGGGYGAMLIFTLILAAAAGFVGYKIGKKHGTVTVNNIVSPTGSDGNNVSQLPLTPVQPVQNSQGGRESSGSANPAPAKTSGNKNTAPAVLGASTPQTYSNAAMHFSALIPSDWRISAQPNEILFTAPDRSVYSIQVYDVTATTDLNFIQSQLQQLPNIHNVAPVTFAGRPALSFNIDGNFRSGYAFVQDGKLYYLMGSDIGSKIQNFQII